MSPVAVLPRTALDEPLGALFERAAARAPDRLAAKGRRHALTYGELDRAANRVARGIRDRAGGAPARVALLFAHDAPVFGAAGRITAAVVDRFGVSLPIPALLEARTVEAMAATVVAGLLGAVSPDAMARPDAIGPADPR